jgi:hypothetical protein
MKSLLLFIPAILSAQYMSTGALVSSRGTGPSYGHCKLVSTSAGMVSGGSNLSNYPLTVNLPADADLATVANGGYVTNAGGSNDIAFYSDCSGVAGGGTQVNPSGTKLTWEIESYTAATGALTAHVLKTTLLAAGDSVGMWFAGTATTFQSTASSVWSASYGGVWHMSSTTVADSTINANDQTANTATSTATGLLDGAVGFNGSTSLVTLTNAASLKPASAMTISAWVKRAGATGAIAGIINSPSQSGTGAGGWILSLNTNVPKFFIDTNGLGNAYATVTAGSGAIADATWTHVAGTWNGTTMTIYVNGVSDGTFSNSSLSYGTPNQGSLVGAYSTFFPGSLDEIRVENVARDGNWLLTTVRNQAALGCSGAACVTVGALQ